MANVDWQLSLTAFNHRFQISEAPLYGHVQGIILFIFIIIIIIIIIAGLTCIGLC